MSKPFPYWIRLFVVSSLSVTLTFNPVFAGRLLHRLKNCPETCQPAACEPVVSCGVVCVPAYVSPDCGGASTSESEDSGCGCSPTMLDVPDCGCGVPSAEISEGNVVSPPATPAPVAPAAPSIVLPKDDSVLPSVSPLAPAPATPPAAKDSNLTEPDNKPTAPSPFEAPVEPAAPKPAAPVQPEIEAPPAPAPAEAAPADLFGDEPAAPKAPVMPLEDAKPAPAAPADDLFGDPAPAEKAAPAPAEAPMDLFGDPPAADAPKPAPAPQDDLFGTPPAAEPEMPAAPAPNTPAPAANNLDDLFGTDPAPAKPETPPANNNDLNDLFNLNEPVAPESGSIEDSEMPKASRPVSVDVDSAASPDASSENSDVDALFGTPTNSESIEQSDKNELKDLFDSSSDSSNTEETNKAGQDTKSDLDTGLDTLFNSSSSAPQPESFRGAEFRSWTDNTGEYAVNARLSVIFPDKVRLLKENGKFSTVTLDRLSSTDLQYINWVAVSLQKSGATKLVNTNTNPGTTNAEVTR